MSVGITTPRARRPPKSNGAPRKKGHSLQTDAVDLELADVRERVVDLRKQGYSYRDISKMVGIAPKTAYDHVQAELLEMREKTDMDRESVRTLELERCDFMLRSLHRRIRTGDPMAIGAAIRVLERRAKYLGLDAPEKSAFVGTLLSPEEASKMSDTDISTRVKALIDRVTGGKDPTKVGDSVNIDIAGDNES